MISDLQAMIKAHKQRILQVHKTYPSPQAATPLLFMAFVAEFQSRNEVRSQPAALTQRQRCNLQKPKLQNSIIALAKTEPQRLRRILFHCLSEAVVKTDPLNEKRSMPKVPKTRRMHRCAVELPHHDWQRLELQSTKELVNKLFMKSLFHQVFEGKYGAETFSK